MKRFLFVWTTILVFCAGVHFVNAQAWRGHGRVTGKVTDTKKTPLEGVTVKFNSPKLGASTEVKTNKKGEWTINGIHGGEWNVDFVKEGFQTKAMSANLFEANYNPPIEVQLEPAQVASTAVEGSGAAPASKLAKAIEGRTLMEQKNYDGAIAKFKEALAENPAVYQIYGDIASAYRQKGDTDKAIENYKLFIEKETAAGVTTPNQNVRIDLGSLYLEKRDLASAEKYLSMVNESAITDPSIFYNLGVSYYTAQNYDKAISYFEKSVQLDPKFVDGYYQLGLVYMAKNNNPKAVENFKKVIEIDPNSAAAKEVQEFIDSLK